MSVRGRLGLVALVALMTAGCGGGPPVDSDGFVVVNNGWPDQLDVSLVAGEYVRDPDRLVTFGTGTVQNVGDRPIVILDVAPLDTFGDIELVDVLVNGPDRDALWIAADDSFPPDVGLGTTAPAIGYVLEPGPTGALHTGINLVQGYRVGVSSDVAGVMGFCVSYRVEGVDADDERRRQCWPNHWLVACEDIDAPECVEPGR